MQHLLIPISITVAACALVWGMDFLINRHVKGPKTRILKATTYYGDSKQIRFTPQRKTLFGWRDFESEIMLHNVSTKSVSFHTLNEAKNFIDPFNTKVMVTVEEITLI